MLSFLHLKPFYIYNLILLVVFSVIVNPVSEFQIMNIFFYIIFHFLLIYLVVYHYSKLLYLIYFIYGLGLDLLWFNEIGPYLLSFMIILFTLKFSLKYLYNMNSIKIYFLLISSLIFLIFIESIFSYLLFAYKPDNFFLMQIIFFSLVLSYPIFIFFSKIDEIK